MELKKTISVVLVLSFPFLSIVVLFRLLFVCLSDIQSLTYELGKSITKACQSISELFHRSVSESVCLSVSQ